MLPVEAGRPKIPLTLANWRQCQRHSGTQDIYQYGEEFVANWSDDLPLAHTGTVEYHTSILRVPNVGPEV
jgi:hypothetical protein